jgi:hypothetical protein
VIETRAEFAGLSEDVLRQVQRLEERLQYYCQIALSEAKIKASQPTLPQIIVCGWLVAHRFRPETDFTLHSSAVGAGTVDVLIRGRQPNVALRIRAVTVDDQGGRAEGGPVQQVLLKASGVEVEDLEESDCYVLERLESRMSKIVGMKGVA